MAGRDCQKHSFIFLFELEGSLVTDFTVLFTKAYCCHLFFFVFLLAVKFVFGCHALANIK